MTKKDDEEKKTWVALVGKNAVAAIGQIAYSQITGHEVIRTSVF